MQKITKPTFFFMCLLSILGWTGIILQYYILVNNAPRLGIPIGETTIRFFSYFTILTNMLVTFSITVLLLFPSSSLGKFAGKTSVQTAVAGYISIVCIVYNIILRKLWQPQGLSFVTDIILHYLIPILYLIYWLFWTKKTVLPFSNALLWLAYPLIYLAYILIRGWESGFYPYPFMNAGHLGFTHVAINAVVLFVAFLLMSVLFIAASRLLAKRTDTRIQI